MNIEEIRKNAPDGANGYIDIFGLLAYYKTDGEKIYTITVDGWKLCNDNFLFKGEIKPLY